LTTVEEARQFVAETRADVLAPALGNSRGMRKSTVTGKERKHLAIKRILEIESATCVPLTLHGGSGAADEDLKAAIRAGVNVHINTDRVWPGNKDWKLVSQAKHFLDHR
jgi:fructose-bisphosphate aldolase class II